jgi:hypothetical protein
VLEIIYHLQKREIKEGYGKGYKNGGINLDSFGRLQ